MALAAVAYARATDRRQVMAATSSIGPGRAQHGHRGGRRARQPAAGAAAGRRHLRRPGAGPGAPAGRALRRPDTTVNDAFRPVSRYFDRITRPEQLLASLPQVARVLTDPADAGPVTLALPQDVQAEEWDFPEAFFEPRLHRVPRPRADRDALAQCRRRASATPSGRCWSWAAGCATRAPPPRRSRSPRRTAYRSSRRSPAARWCRTTTRCTPERSASSAPPSANTLAAEADVVVAVGTRLQDFTTSSWTGFSADVRIVTVNAARFDAVKHGAQAVVGDAREVLVELDAGAGRLGRRRPTGPTGPASSRRTGTPRSTGSAPAASPRTAR